MVVDETQRWSGVADASSKQQQQPHRGGAEWQDSLDTAVSRWRQSWSHPRASSKTDAQKRRLHVQNCAQCQKEEEMDGSSKQPLGNEGAEKQSKAVLDDSSQDPSSQGPGDNDLKSVVVDTEQKPKTLYRATISIAGMTCSSCVNSITHALEAQPWIEDATVNLLTASGTVTFAGKDKLPDVVETIDDAGFDASLESLEEIPLSYLRTTAGAEVKQWKATYAIGGMTCSSCVGNIATALKSLDFVTNIDMNLLSNSATVTFHEKSRLPEIKSAIEDAGYDATLDNITSLNKEPEQDRHRTVSFKIEGLYCRHCPKRISEGLEAKFGNKVEIQKTPTVSDAILRIRYLPELPSFTIRDIIKALGEIDAAFSVSVYHAPTIEERARDLHVRERRRILYRLGLSVIVAIPTFLIGIVFMDLVNEHHPVRMFFMEWMWIHGVSRAQWALFILATPVYFFAADIFHRRALKELRAMWRPGSRTPLLHRFIRFGSMNMLMSLGTSIAYFASVAELGVSSNGKAMIPNSSFYFDSVVFLTMFLLIGRFLEAYSKSKTGDAVDSLGKLRPAEAILIDPIEKRDRKVACDLIEIEDVVRVAHGSSPPFDGIILEGAAKFDESSLTGEARPITKDIGDTVYSGTINKGSPITVKITTISGTSMLDQIIKVVREGQTRRAPVERAADVITSHFVPFVVFIAITTWIIWLSLGLSGSLPSDYRDTNAGGWPLWSLRFAIAVFVVACPCGIGLAAPTALFVGGGLAARHGILVKGGGEAFQEASQLDCIVFDKTGTLTQGGDPQVTDHKILDIYDESESLGMALKLEESSSHPIAHAIVSFCSSQSPKALEVVNVDEIPGKGLKGDFKLSISAVDSDAPTRNDRTSAILGNEALMAEYNVSISIETTQLLTSWKQQGKSVALMAVKKPTDDSYALAAVFSISDPLRPEAIATINALHKRGLDVWLLSGDNPITAQAVGRQLHIPDSNIIASVLPDQKAEKIKYLQKTLSARPSHRNIITKILHPFSEPKPRRALIAMVGDGINDAPALAHADVSIAIGTGSAIALSSSSFILVSSNLSSLLTLIDLSRKVFRRVWFNFGWALVYNVVAMPVAAGVLYPLRENAGKGGHIRLDPVWASLAMALSSVSVVCSSLLLRTKVPGVGFRERKQNAVDGDSEVVLLDWKRDW